MQGVTLHKIKTGYPLHLNNTRRNMKDAGLMRIFNKQKIYKHKVQPPESTNGSEEHMARANSALSWWPVNTCKNVNQEATQ